jgi:uncharacterized cupredoxin-like copper-binding protein
MKRATRASLLLVLALFLAPALTGCVQPVSDQTAEIAPAADGAVDAPAEGSADAAGDAETSAEADPAAADESAAAAMPEAGTMTADGREIVRISLSEYSIDSSHTTFQTGVPYRLVIHDTGVISHELRVLPRGESVTAMAEMGGSHGVMSHDHGNQLLHVGGETLESGVTVERDLTFFEPGEMELACHLPGHFESGMILDIDVSGDAVSRVIRASDITYDPDAMAGMACHAMNTTIMGDCSPADVLRVTQEILAKSEADAGAPMDDHDEMMDEMGEGMMGGDSEDGDHAHDEDTDAEDDHGHDEGAEDDHGEDEDGNDG